jgi:YD repeat-containing protein
VVLAAALVGALVAFHLLAGREAPGQTGEEAPTKYYLLSGPFRFTPTNFGTTGEVQSYGGGPWWLPLAECEITAEGAKLYYVTEVHEGGRLKEVGLWFGGIVCRRFAFRYDADGRLAGRVDTQYEPRREGEDVLKWVARMKGKTPAVACTRELAYGWSADGRTVEVKLVRSEGEEPWVGLPEWPSIGYGQPGDVLETWTLDANGHVTEALQVAYDMSVYSATYDTSGLLLTDDREGTKTQHTYDAKGRLVKTTVQRRIRDTMVFVHGYPDAPPPALSGKEQRSDQRFVVSHAASGHITEVKAAGEVSSLGSFTVKIQRDDQGRIKSMRSTFGVLFPE